MATPAPCSEERSNFFRVCRVFLDHVPEVLRAVFKDRVQARHGHTWDDTPTSGQWLHAKYGKVFSILRPEQVALLQGGRTKDWDPTLLVHVLRSSALCLLLDEIPGATVLVQQNTTVVSVPPTSQLPAGISAGCRICIDNGKKCVYGEVANVSAVPGSPVQIFLAQKVSIKPTGAKVYVCTAEFEAVDRLREMRNAYFAHKDAATTTQDVLERVFKKVKKAYHNLSRSDADIRSLEAIKTEMITDENQRRLSQAYDDLRRSVGELESKQEATGQRVTELESKEKATDQRVTELEGKVETLSQQVQGNNDVASGNADNQPIPPDQPPIPMVPSEYQRRLDRVP